MTIVAFGDLTDTWKEGRKEIFYLTKHSTHFIYGYMASDIWLRTILIVRKETCCRHIGYSFQLTARVLLYAPSHRQDSTYHGLCYTSHGTLAGMRNSSVGSPHEGSIRWPIAPWANTLTTELHLAPWYVEVSISMSWIKILQHPWVLDHPVPHEISHAYFYHFPPIFSSYTNITSKSNHRNLLAT